MLLFCAEHLQATASEISRFKENSSLKVLWLHFKLVFHFEKIIWNIFRLKYLQINHACCKLTTYVTNVC